MARGIRRTHVWKLYIRDKYNDGWHNWTSGGITISKTKAHRMGIHLKMVANRERQFKVVKATAKGYSSPYETGYFQ